MGLWVGMALVALAAVMPRVSVPIVWLGVG